MFDIPQTFGTRRIGPDLAREAGRRSDDWHLAHLYNPRDTVPLSVMPSYPWLFEESAEGVKPKQEALDVVAYLQQLGERYKDHVSAIVYPKPFTVRSKDNFRDDESMKRGEELFIENCVGCHGKTADGISRANNFLRPTAVNLLERYLTSAAVFEVLFSGVKGTGMPSFHEMTQKDLWALSHYVSDLGVPFKEETFQQTQNGESLKKGKVTYDTYCASCHGANGIPEGPVAEALIPKPRDFSRRLVSHAVLKEVLEKGREGTPMPPFADIQGEDLKNLSHYLQNLFTEEERM